jgi:hypothetical protein
MNTPQVLVADNIDAAVRNEAISARGRNVRHEVVITDVHIPFGTMVNLLVEVAVAAIPAAIILVLLGVAIVAGLGALGSFMHG